MTTATKLIKAVSQPAVDKKRDDFEMNFNLSRTGMPALMEEYLSGGDYHLFDPKVLEQDPGQYFNFGFNMENYKSFIAKQLYMRVEKVMIKEEMDKTFKK